MINLFFRSVLVLALLFGLLFGVGMAVMAYLNAPLWAAVVFALLIVFLQYLLGPWILQLIYRIDWRDPESIDPGLRSFMDRVCNEKRIPLPRFGVIHDGNPNAFTFGHYPGDARLVVTTGLIDLLSEDERNAVVAHELGHIAHWDFVVMTVAAAVPLVLYLIYRAAFVSRRGRRRGKGSGYVAAVGLISFLAYLISQYIVLLLSRVREYYADQFSGDVTRNPDALSGALVKIAYGLARAPKDKKGKDDRRSIAARPFGIFDPKIAQSLALAGAGSGSVSVDAMEGAMKWDLWNPWANLFELASSHPLPAKRIRALGKQTETYGQLPRYKFRLERQESYWDEFLVDLLVNFLPLLGLLAGVGLALSLGFAGKVWIPGGIGLGLLLFSVAMWVKRRTTYRHDFKDKRTVKSLVTEVKVSGVRPIPCMIEGKIIGRGVPGLFFSDDLVLQDHTGFMIVDYRQPLRIWEFFFGWFKAEHLIGKTGTAAGWFRRSPRPYFEMRRMILDDGEKVTSYLYPVVQFFVYAGMVAGVILLLIS